MSRPARRPVAVALALLALSASAGCAGAPDASNRVLRVLAASSLTEAFTALGRRFETEHPGVRVVNVFDSSATLATQVREGAPADVLATADGATMQTVIAAREAERSSVFATNRMVLVTPADNPAGIRSLADLDRSGVSYVSCVPSAPCGAIADRLLARDGVSAAPKSLEVDVKAVLTKVTSGEVDAGLVYASDARSAGQAVSVFAVPGSGQLRNSYRIAVLDRSRAPALAQQWVDLVGSQVGRRVLRRAGFGVP